ncbi:MAG: DEAD/DEAH box helicase family protein, partial [Bdellovibrionales bacterium]|nr:DEAD/DEAH box helicase family protein [Bdellovibrionales bacterium]
MNQKLSFLFISLIFSLNSTFVRASDNSSLCYTKGFSSDPIQTLTRQLEAISPNKNTLLPNFPITSCGADCFSLHSNSSSSFQIELAPHLISPEIVLSPSSLKVLKLPSWSALENTSLLKFWLVGHELHPQISPTETLQYTKTQKIAFKAIKTARQEGSSSILLISPTGTGKTLILSRSVKDNLFPGLHLVTAHQIHLVDQLHQALQEELKETGTFIINWNERSNHTFADEVEQATTLEEPVVLVITTQTLKSQLHFLEDQHSNLYEELIKNTKGVYLDEAHHLGAFYTKAVLLKLQEQSGAFLVGTTATPVHHEINLRELFEREHWSYLNGEKDPFQSHPPEKIIEQLSLAIQEGEITPFEDLYIFGPVNFQETEEHPLFTKGESNFYVLNPHHYNRLAGLLYRTIQSNRKGFIVTASISEANRLVNFLSQVFKDTEFEAYHSDLTRGERQGILNRSEQSEAHYIVAVRALDEGVDLPHLSAYIDLNTNVSVKQMVHRIGRVLRLYPGKLGSDIVLLSGYMDATRAEELLSLLDMAQVSSGFSGGVLRYASGDSDIMNDEVRPLSREELLELRGELRRELENSTWSFWKEKPPIEKVAEILRRKGIKTQTEYWEKRKSDPELQLLPDSLPHAYKMKWSDIQKLVGLKVVVRAEDHSLEEIAEILRRKEIRTLTEYWEKRKSDPELQKLPYNLNIAYNIKWSDIQKLVGLIKPPIEKVAEILQKKGIKT